MRLPALIPALATVVLLGALAGVLLRRNLAIWSHRRQSAADAAEEASIERYELLWRGFTLRWQAARRFLDQLLLASTIAVACLAAVSVYLVLSSPAPVDVTLFQGSPIGLRPAANSSPGHHARGGPVAAATSRPGPHARPGARSTRPGGATAQRPASTSSPAPASSPSSGILHVAAGPRPVPTPSASPSPSARPSPSPTASQAPGPAPGAGH